MEKESVLLELPTSELTEIISINEICRLCANQHDKLIGIYTEDGENNDLASKMNSYLPVKVDKTDDLPLQCCWQCASTVLAWHELFVTSIEADRRLRSYQFVTEKQLIVERSEADLQQIDTTNTNEAEEIINKNTVQDKMELSTSDEDVADDEKKSKAFQRGIGFIRAVDLSSESCSLCNLSFGTRTMLKNHMFEQHNLKQPKCRRKKIEINSVFDCAVCQKSFTRKFDMQRHILKKHPETNVEPSSRSKNLEIVNKCKVVDAGAIHYECDVCNIKFKACSPFVLHYNIHTDKKLHCCHFCGKKFQRNAHLKRHVDRLHYGIKKYACEYCDQTFTSKTTKDEHLNIHTNSRPYVCDTCGKSFRQSSSLYIHKKFHQNIFPFACNVCQKKFRRMGELKNHTFIHTGERQFSCEVCNKSFRLRQDLKRHMKTHLTTTAANQADALPL